MGLLSIVIFLPLICSAITLLLPESQSRVIKAWGMAASVGVFGVSLAVLAQFKGATYHFQLMDRVAWIPKFGIQYEVGVDGVSIWLVLLTTFLSAVSMIFSGYVTQRIKTYVALMLMLETAMLGVFLSLDLILFYTFFEFSLIPMYFLIAIWGGQRRSYASIKFFLFTFSGSIFMLVGMIALANHYAAATHQAISFSILDIQQAAANGTLWAGAGALESLLFWSFAVALLIKCPAIPFHTWLPDAHTEAPTAGSIILAGVLLKMGTYGLLRFALPLFPDAATSFVPIFMGIAVAGIIYGAIVSAVQTDLKRLVAYSSVAHMGFVILGIFSLTYTGMLGGAYQQLNHGISTGALFLLVGLIYERRHTRQFKDFGGLKAQMPIYAALFLIIMLSSVGLPGLNGFVGEFLSLLGAFEACFAGKFGLNLSFAVIACFGVVLAAVYLLYMFQQMFYGKNVNPENQRLRDIKPWEIALVGSLVVFAVWGGLVPGTFLKPMEASLQATRLMTIDSPGQRPVWNDPTLDIDMRSRSETLGALVRIAPRSTAELGDPVDPLSVIAPGQLHFGSSGGTSSVAARSTSSVRSGSLGRLESRR